MEQSECLAELGQLFIEVNQLDEAEEATMHSISLLGKGQEFQLCDSNRVLGHAYLSKGEKGKAIHHYSIALGIADTFNWHDQLFWTHESLAKLFREEGEFENAHAHIKKAKELAVDNKYFLGRAMDGCALTLYRQGRCAEAASEALGAIEIYRELGAANDLESCKDFLRRIEQSMKKP